MEVLVVPVVALLAVVSTLALVDLVAPSIYHAQCIQIRRCTLAVCQLLKQTRVGQLMVVAEFACVVEPSMVAHQEVVAAIQRHDESSLPAQMQLAAARTYVEEVLCMVAARTNLLCMVAARTNLEVVLSMVASLSP